MKSYHKLVATCLLVYSQLLIMCLPLKSCTHTSFDIKILTTFPIGLCHGFSMHFDGFNHFERDLITNWMQRYVSL